MKNNNILKGQQGFTLVEILVALTLVVGIFILIPSSSTDEQHSNLESTIFDFERAVRFSVNEAILRNSVVRITIELTSEPQIYYIEYSTSGGLILPEYEEEKNMSIRDRERQAEIQKDLDSQFSKIDEFSEEPKVVPRFVTVLGLGSYEREIIQLDGKAFIYFYPTGEKDAAILFFSTEQEFASLEIAAFEDIFQRNFSIYSESDTFNIEGAQESKMKENFEKWLKN